MCISTGGNQGTGVVTLQPHSSAHNDQLWFPEEATSHVQHQHGHSHGTPHWAGKPMRFRNASSGQYLQTHPKAATPAATGSIKDATVYVWDIEPEMQNNTHFGHIRVPKQPKGQQGQGQGRFLTIFQDRAAGTWQSSRPYPGPAQHGSPAGGLPLPLLWSAGITDLTRNNIVLYQDYSLANRQVSDDTTPPSQIAPPRRHHTP